MNIFVCGIDGYIGWPLAHYFRSMGHYVYGLDDLSRRNNVRHQGSSSLIPIDSFIQRAFEFDIESMNLSTRYQFLKILFERKKPDVIVHLAEQPSAPYSMSCYPNCYRTQSENILGTLALLWVMRVQSFVMVTMVIRRMDVVPIC